LEGLLKNPTALVWISLWAALGIGATPGCLQGQTPEQEVEALIRAQSAAWDSGDLETLSQYDWMSAGFGVRTLLPRGTQEVSREFATYMARVFFESMEYYRTSIDELHIAVYDEVAVAWGFHTEDFQARGREPEILKVRFSLTLLKTEDGWKAILAHRDSQPFDSEGNYIPLTKSTGAPSSPVGG
jgi:hypothetical protein